MTDAEVDPPVQGAAKSEASGPGASEQVDASASAADRATADARDRALIHRLKDGDDRAFEELVRIYQDRVFSLSLRMIGNRQEAEDLAQEVFMTVHRAIASYRGDGRFYTWLYRIASNTCKNRIKYLRGRHFNRSVPVDETPRGPGPRG